MSKNVLIVVRWPVGGIRTYIRYVFSKPEFKDYQYTIIAPDLSEMRILLDSLKDEIDVTYIPTQDSNKALFQTVLRVIWKNKFDLIHSHGFTSGLACVLPAKLMRVPHIMTIHDVFHNAHFAGFWGKCKKLLMGKLFSLIEVIQSVGSEAQDNLLSFFPKLQNQSVKLITIYNGINIQQFESSEVRDLRAELNLTEQHFIIGFLGRFMAQKGFVYLVHALRELVADNTLTRKPIVVAVGSGGFIREDTQYIQDNGLDEYFKFLPFVSNSAPTLRGLDVLTIPSLWEACPLLPMEAMVAGVPIIGTNCIGLNEIIENSPALLIKPKSSEELANAIKTRMQDSGRQAAQDYIHEAKSRFDVCNTASSLSKVYNEVVN